METAKQSLTRLNTNDIARTIVRDIANQTYRSGARITEAEVCSRLGISRTPVREAFRLLQSRGILLYSKSRGMTVATYDHTKMRRLCDLRCVLLVQAAREAVPVVTEDTLIRMEEINEELLHFDFEHGLRDGVHILDSAFHLLVAEASGNELLYDFIQTTVDQLYIYCFLIPMRAERVAYTYEEHRNIIRSLREHNADRAAMYTELHFGIAGESLDKKWEDYERLVQAGQQR